MVVNKSLGVIRPEIQYHQVLKGLKVLNFVLEVITMTKNRTEMVSVVMDTSCASFKYLQVDFL